ncbi:hypothetical protein [Paenibacillus oryzisoli]|uniref:Transposase n=1 Tax=Paenibacillus oryzisoli TaxID=1850517 RepID=A0A198AIH3_9BACL|nr:hypothetical protein [Paenibacillus oryzisoli]OAS21047.1 hypothetical protein A8708_29565 [Paenibacillus oryzisoli]
MKEPALSKVMTVLDYLSQDTEARRMYEMRQKALHDEASMLEVAKNMLGKGMDIATISELTGISSDDLEKLKQMH